MMDSDISTEYIEELLCLFEGQDEEEDLTLSEIQQVSCTQY